MICNYPYLYKKYRVSIKNKLSQKTEFFQYDYFTYTTNAKINFHYYTRYININKLHVYYVIKRYTRQKNIQDISGKNGAFFIDPFFSSKSDIRILEQKFD